MSLGGSLGPGEGDKGFDERIVRLNDGTHLFAVSHIHSMQGRTVIIRLGYDLAPLRARMFQFFLLLFIAVPLALILAAFAGQAISMPGAPFAPRTDESPAPSASPPATRRTSRCIERARRELGNMARVRSFIGTS